MTLKKIILISVVVLIAACGAMVFSFYRTYQSQVEMEQVQSNLQVSLDLAAELRRSSLALTAAVREFVVTGDEKFIKEYEDIVAIRDGRLPRPQNLMVATGQQIALMDLMREAGFSGKELTLLEESSNRSNELITLETEAINAARGLFPDASGKFTVQGVPDRERAISLVFGGKYDEYTAQIMAPTEEFNKILHERLSSSLSEAQQEYKQAMLTFEIIAGGVLLLFIAFLALVYWQIVRPILRCDVFANEIAAGNMDEELNYSSKNEIGLLAQSLRSIPATLKKIIAEYENLRYRVGSGDLEANGNAAAFSGKYADLIDGTNSILNRLKTMMDAIPSPVVVLDRDLKANYCNLAAQKVAGENYKGKTCGQLMGREDYGTPQDALQIAIRNKAAASAETKAHPQGMNLDIAYTAIPFYNPAGELTSVLQLVTDLTALKQTQRTIVEVANNAMDISNRVASASEQLSAQVEEVSRGTDTQRDRAASTATAMEEMNTTVLEVARNAAEASESAEACRTKATEGSHLVSEVNSAIQLVNEISQEINQNMEKLSEEAQAIGGVMDVISDIADQTNLLALNAAIEAARAGEAGRGFAVVADEVRKLAEKTMTATNEVGNSIKGIQASTAHNRERVVIAAESAEKANELAITSGRALDEIVDLASTNSSLIASIATAAEEQSATSDEINNAVEEINRIASETADGMNQSNEAVADLAAQAQELKELLQRLQS